MITFDIVKDYKGKLNADHLPRRGTSASAGYDFRSAEDIVIPSHFNEYLNFAMTCTEDTELPKDLDEMKAWLKANKMLKPTLVPTGVKAIIPSHMYLSLDNRSSVPLNSLLIVANGRGIIDADYQFADNDGHIHVMFINLSPFPIQIKKGDRIAQGILETYNLIMNDAPLVPRRKGGFGSTGQK